MKSVNRAKLDLIIAVTAFGTIGIFVRYINLPSSVIAFVRGAVGAVFLLLLLYLRRTPFRWASVQPHWKLLALSGAIISFNWITLFEAYRYTTVATATLCYYMAPVFVTLASPFLFHEKLTPRKLLCVLAALCGMVFVSGVPQSGLPEAGEATGILLALLSAVLYASDVSINKFLDQVPACERTLVQLAVAALVMISGVEDTGTFGTRFTAGLGSVEGRTWYTLTANVPLPGTEKRYTGREKRLHSVIFGSRRIKFFANSSIDSGQCDKITERTPVRVCGLPLPIIWETETLRFYETEPVTVTQARRQKETGAALEAYLHSLVDPYGEVTASQVASRLRGDVLTVTLTAECREELGTQAPIYTANEPDGVSG